MSHEQPGQPVPSASPPRSIANGHASAGVQKVITHQAARSQSPSSWDYLLTTDPKKFERNPKKLSDYFVLLQGRCKKQRELLLKYHQDDLERSKTASSSRTPTQESDSSMRKPVIQASVTRYGTAIVFNTATNKIKLVQRQGMIDSDYIQTALPSYHWWQDRLQIYFRKEDQPRSLAKVGESLEKVLVRQRKFEGSEGREWDWSCSIKPAKLGPWVRIKRILRSGNMDKLYVYAPGQELSQGMEMDTLKSYQQFSAPSK